MKEELRGMMAAAIAGGLVSAHGIDHGGIDADQIAARSLAIADSILARTHPAEFAAEQCNRAPLSPE